MEKVKRKNLRKFGTEREKKWRKMVIDGAKIFVCNGNVKIIIVD